MKTWIKALLITLSAAIFVTAAITGTLAYLTHSEAVVNTFTVGQVNIKLDEAAVDEAGEPLPDQPRVKQNQYHIIPGGEYYKDPTVTVLADSESAYIRMLVTVNKASAFNAIFTTHGEELVGIFAGIDSNWVYCGEKNNAAEDSVTYEFRYSETVNATETDKVLEPLFTSIKVPGFFSAEDLESVAGFKITVTAHAIQEKGFENETAAWAAFEQQK